MFVTIEEHRRQSRPPCCASHYANFQFRAEGITVSQIIQKILTLVPPGKEKKLL